MWTSGEQVMEKLLKITGFAYDSKQEIFYSTIDAWQRKFGYCRLYDEAAAPLSLIMDCEPIHFEYSGKRWLIQMWKGQYALTTGCEIGVYNTDRPDLNIPGLFNGPFFDSVSDEDRLHMSYTLKKNGQTLFTREDKHWWLTGFILGKFSEPWELTMDINITLKDDIMLNAFVNGLKLTGYSEDDISITNNTVGLHFDETRTPQPITRIPVTDKIIQRKNEFLCNLFQELTTKQTGIEDKLLLISEKYPDFYGTFTNIGKTKKIYEYYQIIQYYMKKNSCCSITTEVQETG